MNNNEITGRDKESEPRTMARATRGPLVGGRSVVVVFVLFGDA